MPEGIDAGSFDFYEGIRILIPGAMGLGAAEGLTRTLRSSGDGLGLSTAPAVVAALILGLCFYYVDAPAKAAIMVPDRPTSTMASWGLKPRAKTTLLNNYFVLLDAQIPSSIRARALYMGSMYRIGMEAIYVVALVSAVALSLNAWSNDSETLSIHNIPTDAWGGAVPIIGVAAFAVWRDRYHPAFDIATVARSTFDQVVIVALTAGLAALIVGADKFDWEIPAWAYGLPAVGATVLWATRYFRGYVDKAKVEAQKIAVAAGTSSGKGRIARLPTSAANATLLLVLAHMFVLATVSIDPLAESRLSETELRGWMALMLVSVILVCSRGHEKRLRGGYATQNTWLLHNKDLVIAAYFDKPEDQEAPKDQEASIRLSRLPTWLRILVRLFGRN